jgi:hypothetical protein
VNLAVVNDEGVAQGEEEQGAAQQQAADGNAEVAARCSVTAQHNRSSIGTYSMAVERKDSNDESDAAALVPARSRHTNVPATPIPCQPSVLMLMPSHEHGVPSSRLACTAGAASPRTRRHLTRA